VVGFNDMPFADRFSPPLTTIGIPHYEIGVAAADLLLELMQDGADGPREVVLPAKLIVRGSTRRP
jgi:LacI family transcriptional regulator